MMDKQYDEGAEFSMSEADWQQHGKELRAEYDALPEGERLPFLHNLVCDFMDGDTQKIEVGRVVADVTKLLNLDYKTYQAACVYSLTQNLKPQSVV